MQIRLMPSAAALILFVGANAGALAETWKLPEEIAPKSEAGAPAVSTPATAASAPVTAEAAPAPAPVDKAAKKKECKSQAGAKGLHGKQRRQFMDECEKS